MSIITVTVGSYTYDETQIIINPTISKSICSGGFSVGNTACGCLKVGVPNNGHSEGDSVKISYNGNQIMGEFFISDIEKCGYAKLNPTDVYKTQMVMLTCYDGMSKLDDYMSFDLTTVTPADICDEIESQTGYLFKDGSKLGTSFEVTKEEAESRTMREWLGIFGCYVGCNWSLRTYWLNDVLVSRITQLPLYYSGNSFSAIINAPVTVENAVTFSRVVSRGKDGTFKSGTDSDYTLEISCQYATQDSNDIIQSNIENQAVPYTAFKCDKLKTNYVFMDIGDVITLSGHSGGLKIYNQTVTISINGIYMSVGADVQKKKLNDDIEYSSEELKPITDFAVSVSNGVATLTWKNPTSNFTGVILKRKASTDFNNIFEGDNIYVGNAETYSDTLPNDYTTYYYKILSYQGNNYNADCATVKADATETPPPSKSYRLHGTNTILDECVTYTMGWIKYSTSHYPKNPDGYCFPAFSAGYAYIAENAESVHCMHILAYGGSSPTAESYIETYRGSTTAKSQTITIDFYNPITNYNNKSVYFRVYSRAYQDLTAPLTLISEKSNLTNPELFTTTGIKKITLNTNTSGQLVEFVVRIGCTATNSSSASVDVINVYYGG